MNTVQEQLKRIGVQPGIYQFFDQTGRLLYIGKAKNLKNRVRSYFHKRAELSPAKQIMIEKIRRIETILTHSETEALLLESTLIKQHQPPFNIDLKDDKNFLYIKVTVQEEYPRVFATRILARDKAKYFGPFTSAEAVRDTLRVLKKIFPHRNFQKMPTKTHVQYLTRRYPQLFGPAQKTEYLEHIRHILLFLQGRYREVTAQVTERMRKAAAAKQFEKAAQYRDSLRLLDRMQERQRVISTSLKTFDVIGIAQEEQKVALSLCFIREGKLLGKNDFLMTNTTEEPVKELVRIFIERYYPSSPEHVKTVVVPALPDTTTEISHVLGITLVRAQRGEKKALVDLAELNARDHLIRISTRQPLQTGKIKQALVELAKETGLSQPPRRIECFDISNIQGAHPVGSMVVFHDGLPAKQEYRKFKIKTVKGANDPAMMAEVLKRRFGPSHQETWKRPELIILDGGKGQLSIVHEAISSNLNGITLLALAKREEILHRLEHPQEIILPPGPAYYLIQRIRDEAHRFAIGYYRKRHRKSSITSILDEIPGFGTVRKRALLRAFGSIDALRQAPPKELERLVGPKIAQSILEKLL
ncbi:MAG: excinuclease ABC subunit UvrC [Patescibacteria group bacterium]